MNSYVLWGLLQLLGFMSLGYCAFLVLASNEIWALALSMYIGAEGLFGLANYVWKQYLDEEEEADELCEVCECSCDKEDSITFPEDGER